MTDITITATRNPNNDMAWDEDSQEYIPSPTPTSNPTVRELEANNTVYDIISKGVMNNNNETPLKMWSGTRAEYNAIETKDANTLYNITDDTFSISLLERIWPVGSIYIGTMSTCPLAAIFGTWTLVAADRVLQGAGTRGSVGTTVNESLPNITGKMVRSSSIIGEKPFFNDSTNDLTGALKQINGTTSLALSTTSSSAIRPVGFEINASWSNSTYQDNAPVQQDAYLVNIWERTA